MSSSYRLTSRVLLAALIAACACAALPALADGVGVLLAPAGERMVEAEALYADAVVVGLATEGQRAVLLHEASPMVRATGVALPAVRAGDDWTPLGGVLERVATTMRLDYVLLTALRTEDGGVLASGLLVVRGGEQVALASISCERGADAAATVVERVLAGIDGLPEPHDRADEALPLTPAPTPTPAPVEDEPIVDAPPGAGALPGPAASAPVVVADEPPLAPDTPTVTPPEPVDDALAAAEKAYNAGELAAAERLLSASLRESGASARAYFLRARLSLGRQDRAAAMTDLRRAVTIDATLADAQVWLGRLLAEQGLWQSAQDHYERAIAADPTHLEGLLGLARLYRDHGHRRKAIDLLTAADDLGQSNPSVLMLLAELHGGEGNVELAERFFVRAAAATSGEQRAAAWERLGDLYVGLHRHREALTCYVKAAELSPSRSSMVERRYTEVMTAADGTVQEALTSGWGIFEDFAQNGIGEREMVHRTLSEMDAELNEALRFAESINPPGALSERHARRQFAYSLAVEASVLARSWLDLGDDLMLERAQAVHADAAREFERLRAMGAG